jgi:hypothetical protein
MLVMDYWIWRFERRKPGILFGFSAGNTILPPVRSGGALSSAWPIGGRA